MTTPKLTTIAQLRAQGVSRRELEALLRGRDLERVRRGTFSPPLEGSATQRHCRLVQATLPHIHPEAVVSHRSAAAWHGMPLEISSLEQVTVTRSSGVKGRRSPTLDVRAAQLGADDVVEIDGVRVTSLARTAADLARELSHAWGVIGCDHVLRRDVSRDELEAQVAAARGWQGAVRLRAAVAFADPRSESVAESISRVQFAQMALPQPVPQFEIVDNYGFVARTDFCWPEHGLVGEVDGRVKYAALLRPGETAADVVMAEKRREESIRQAGFWIVRWGWQEAWHAEVLERLVRRALANAPRPWVG